MGLPYRTRKLLKVVRDVRGRNPELVESTWLIFMTAGAMLKLRESSVHLEIVKICIGGLLDSTDVLQEPVYRINNIRL